jgi:hypothetical protein
MAEVRPEAAAAESGLEALVADINRGLAAEGVRASAITLLRPRSILKTTSGKLRRRDCRAAHEEVAAALRLAGRFKGLSGSPHDAAAKGSATGPRNRIPLDAVLHYWSELPAASAPPPPSHSRTISASPSAASLATTRSMSNGDTSQSSSPRPQSNGKPTGGVATRRPSPHAQLDQRPPSPVATHHADGRPLSKIEMLAAESSALFNRVVVVEHFSRAGTTEARAHARVQAGVAPGATLKSQSGQPGAKLYQADGWSWSNSSSAKAAAGASARRRGWLSERNLGNWVKLALVAAVIAAIAWK